jgi:hypothetical protein
MASEWRGGVLYAHTHQPKVKYQLFPKVSLIQNPKCPIQIHMPYEDNFFNGNAMGKEDQE